MAETSMQALQQTSFLGAGDPSYLEQLYESYLKHPSGSDQTVETNQTVLNQAEKQIKVQALIEAYRLLGHLQADLDPLKMKKSVSIPELTLDYYAFSEGDLSQVFDAGMLPGPNRRSLKQIIQDLQTIYCGTMASEFMHIPDSVERAWVAEQIEQLSGKKRLSSESKLRILDKLIAAEGLEKYLAAKYPGAKRFSMEGVDSLMVVLDTWITQAGILGTQEIVIGMAHRGRLNVLVNIFGKNPGQLFDEFEGKHDQYLESGDVKYHQGFSSDVDTPRGSVHLALVFNPSHLEIVTPVACGSVRARQDRQGESAYNQIIGVVIHGDGAFSGQGVVMEALNMSRTQACEIGGTLHLILNNQIGFTTSNPQDARSTLYCSDIGKMIAAPIFHVNADDPEAVLNVAQLALTYRNTFNKDVIVDLVGYRRHGHNEADEPAATQPQMYKVIRALPTVLKTYSDRLVQQGVVTAEQVESLANQYRDRLTQNQAVQLSSHHQDNGPIEESKGYWQPYFTQDWRLSANTTMPIELLKKLAEQLTTLPTGFRLHPRVEKIMAERVKMTRGELPIDWGYAETMAYAALLQEGYSVRISGQDCARGTFFHRHAVLHHQETDEQYTPLQHLSNSQGNFSIYDSILSEEAVLAFEYGYSATYPDNLVIWEAQFGDFVNGAQVVIDQFISSGEHKWGRLTGLVLLLPHGYEGQGPEHSSARLERFLQLCAEHNMQVCLPTTPAQVFHMLRRQLIRPLRKPLIVMTPKSLLRHKLAVSQLEDFSTGGFLPVIAEIDDLAQEPIRRVILCSGKIYYDLLEHRRAEKKQDIVIVRIEQLYPFPEQELQSVLNQYAGVKEIVWCQEEPQNQGAWYSSGHHMEVCLQAGQVLKFVGRKPSSAPAVGYLRLHQEQQEALVKEALA